jgi:hypothetical protein
MPEVHNPTDIILSIKNRLSEVPKIPIELLCLTPQSGNSIVITGIATLGRTIYGFSGDTIVVLCCITYNKDIPIELEHGFLVTLNGISIIAGKPLIQENHPQSWATLGKVADTPWLRPLLDMPL